MAKPKTKPKAKPQPVQEGPRYSDATVQSALKRLNQRLTDLEKAKYEYTQSYKSLVEFAKQFGDLGTTASGHTKFGKRWNELTEDERNLIVKWSKHKNFAHVSKEKQRAKNKFKREHEGIEPTPEELRKVIEEQNEIHEFIQENGDYIYKVKELYDAVHRKTLLTSEEVVKLFNVKTNKAYQDKDGNFIGDGWKGDESAMEEGQEGHLYAAIDPTKNG